MKIKKFSFVIFLFVLFSPGISASAHAELESSNPAEGSIVEIMPTQITLTFGEKLLTLGEENVNTLNLSNNSGVEVKLSPVTIDGEVLSATVDSTSNAFTPGKYQISYRVVSTDGHPIKGEISFEFASPKAIAEGQGEEGELELENGLFDFNPLFILLVIFIGLIITALVVKRKRR